jgi:hypothetical protein
MPDQAAAELIKRPPRAQPPSLRGEIELPAPPAEAPSSPLNLLATLLPAAGIAALGGLYLALGGANAALIALPTLTLGGLGALTALISYALGRRQARLMHVRSLIAYHRLLDRRLARSASSARLTIARGESAFSVGHGAALAI